ncbi:MAG: tetratricopeptide repeat protein, partial [Rhodothermales bacterium]|nr:tetratricopeptide repeat protein [Rhodothermales bacterium]
FPRAEAAARRALALDTTLADALVPLALARWQYHGDRAGAGAAFQRALALNPSDATARQNYGQFLSLTGRFEEGLDQLERARALDPLSPVIATDLASAYLFDRRYEEAVTRYRAVLATEPGFPVALVFLGMAYELLGRTDAAVAAAEQALETGGRNPLWLAGAGRAYAASGRTADARTVLAELEAMAAERFVSPYAVALIHAALGDAAAALALLEQALALHDPYLIYLPVDPRLDALRGDPRFAALERGETAAPP